MFYVISTMASSVTYCLYDTRRKDMNVILESVTIKGKTGVTDKKTLICATGGTITPITDKQFEWLNKDPLFKFHEKKGFLRVEKTKNIAENKAEKDAEVRDKSSQMKDEDFIKQKIKPPKTSEEEVMTEVAEESK